MIFEIPIQHFPPQRITTDDRSDCGRAFLRRAKCKLLTGSCLELSRAVAEKPEVTRPRVNSYFDNGTSSTHKVAITRSQSVPVVPRERQLSRSEKIQKSIGAFARRVSTLISIPSVTA